MKEEKEAKFIFDSETTPEDYGNMAVHFSMFYWQYVRFGTFLVLCLVLIFGIISNQSKSEYLISFLLLEFFMLIIYKIRLKEMAKNLFVKSQQKYALDTSFINTLYDDYFMRTGEYTTRKVPYERISKTVETETHFYMEIDGGIIILQKDKCTNEAIEFIREKCKKSLNVQREKSLIIKIKNPEFLQAVMNVLFILNIVCIPGALYTVNLANVGTHGFQFVKNLWIFWLWLPIPVLSIILGLKYKKTNSSFDKNILTGFIVGILLLVFGCFCLFPTFEVDYKKIYDYEDELNITLPTEGELLIQEYDTYFDKNIKGFIKIDAYYENENIIEMDTSIKNNRNWIPKAQFKSEFKIFIPTTMLGSESSFYSIYNKTLDEYNTMPDETGEYLIYVMMFDGENKHLEINEYSYSYVK